MISILLPTRNRPRELNRAVDSIRDTSDKFIEIVLYVDDDSAQFMLPDEVECVVGPRIVLSDCWNKCAEKACGSILMMGADDMIFRTQGWDRMIEDAFDDCPDRILMVHGNDGKNGENFAAFPVLHRKWVDAVGYFVPPYFVGDYPDTWVFDVANALGRRKYLPYLQEHLHWIHGKAPKDATYQERLEREQKENPAILYKSLEAQRQEDIAKLRLVMR